MKSLASYMTEDTTTGNYTVLVVDDKGNIDDKSSTVFDDEKKATDYYKKTSQTLKGKKGYKVQIVSTIA